MSQELIFKNLLDKKKIDRRQYTVALINKAQQSKVLAPDQAQDLQVQIMELVQKMILKYTGGDSTSIRAETANRLLLSVLYCLDAHSGSIDDPASCLKGFGSQGVAAAYKHGLELIDSAVLESRSLFEQICAHRLKTELIAYNDTLDHGLPDFFSQYDRDFFAHECMAAIDYPLAHDDQSRTGIFYIKQYLASLELENAFCRCFRPREVEALLHDYGDAYRIDYRDCLINVYDLVLVNAVMAVMIGQPPGGLAVNSAELAELQKRLAGRSLGVVRVLSGQMQRKLLTGLGITDPSLLAYARQSELELGNRLHRALEMNQLDKMAIISNRKRQRVRVELVPGHKMDDDVFRELIEKLLNCAESGAKAAMILEAVQSIEDFVDILKADCLFSQDYTALFTALGEMEMSFLTRMVCQEEWRDSRESWPEMLAKLDGVMDGWQSELIKYCLQTAYQPEWAVRNTEAARGRRAKKGRRQK